MMRPRQRANRAESNLLAIGVRRTVLMQTSALQFALIGLVALVLVMNCRTSMTHVSVDGAAAVRVPALRHHSPGKHRVRGRSAVGFDRGSSLALADQASELQAKYDKAPASSCDGRSQGSRCGGCGGTRLARRGAGTAE